MNQQIFNEFVKKLNLSPTQTQRLGKALQAAVAQLPTAPAKVNVNFHLTPASSLRGTHAPAGKAPGFERELAQLPPALRKKLLELEPKVLAWVSASPTNASQFLMDPVGSLHKAVPGLDATTVRELTQLRGKIPHETPSGDFHIASIKLDAKKEVR